MAQANLKAVITAEDKASKTLRKVGKETKNLNKGFSKLVGTVQGLGAMRLATALGGLFIVRKLINLTKDSIRLAGIQEKAEARLASVMKQVNNATKEEVDSLKDYAIELQRTTTFGDEQTISAMAMLGTFQLNTKQIKELTPRILDMGAAMEKSSGTATDLESITIAVGKAMTMGIGSLSRYGVVITDTQRKMFQLADAEEKVIILGEALDANFKGISTGIAQTYSGQVTQFTNAWEDLKEQVGKGLMPALVELTGSLKDTFTEMNKGGGIARGLMNVMGKVTIAFGVTTHFVKSLGIGLASLWVIMGRKSERKTMEKDLDTLDNTLQDYNGTVEDEMKLYKAREKLYKEQKQQQSEYTDTLANLGDQAGDLDKKLSDLATRVRGWGKDTNEFWDKLVSGSGATAAAMDKVGESAKEMADKQKQAMEKVATEAKSFINTLKDIQQQEKDNTSEFIKSQAKRKQSFKENLTDMVYEAEQKRLAISKEIHLLDRKVKLTKEEKERRAELSEEVKKYYEEVAIGTKALGVGMPGALTPEMTAAATRGDIERYVGAYKSEQAGATVELGAEQEALQAGRRIGGTIFNFDFSNANITNIEQLKNDIIAAINRTNLLTEQGAM